jgi:hypothetical protein
LHSSPAAHVKEIQPEPSEGHTLPTEEFRHSASSAVHKLPSSEVSPLPSEESAAVSAEVSAEVSLLSASFFSSFLHAVKSDSTTKEVNRTVEQKKEGSHPRPGFAVRLPCKAPRVEESFVYFIPPERSSVNLEVMDSTFMKQSRNMHGKVKIDYHFVAGSNRYLPVPDVYGKRE